MFEEKWKGFSSGVKDGDWKTICLTFSIGKNEFCNVVTVKIEIVTSEDFYLQSAALKEAIDDLEWPGSSVQITLQPAPPSVMFKGEGHGDLQVQYGFNIWGG